MIKVDEVVGDEAAAAAAALQPGEVLLLENTRFEAGEKKNDPELSAQLADMADIYVDDAFGSAHRAHASTEGAAQAMRAKGGDAVAGFLMGKELEALGTAVANPPHPYVAIMGGAKISDKIKLIDNLLQKAEKILIGGGMANTFLHARGIDVGASLCEHDLADTVREIEAKAKAAGCEILLPVDGVVAAKFEAGARSQTVAIDAVPADMMILDVGPDSVADLNARLAECRTLLWNGPLGAFEIEPFGEGTFMLANKAAELTKAGRLVSVAGGGDTVAALNSAGVAGDYTYVSSAGGAFLEWLEGKELPGVAALARGSV